MLYLLSEKEYRKGSMRLKNKLMNGKIIAGLAGETLVWLTK